MLLKTFSVFALATSLFAAAAAAPTYTNGTTMPTTYTNTTATVAARHTTPIQFTYCTGSNATAALCKVAQLGPGQACYSFADGESYPFLVFPNGLKGTVYKASGCLSDPRKKHKDYINKVKGTFDVTTDSRAIKRDFTGVRSVVC